MFVSEHIRPATPPADTVAMAMGEPGLPEAFKWRDVTLAVGRVLKRWKETGPCDHGSAEQYVKKHWFELETTGGRVAKIYFERQGRPPNFKKRWWLYSIEE